MLQSCYLPCHTLCCFVFVIYYSVFMYMHYGTTFVVDTCFSLLVMFTDFYVILHCSV